MLKTTRGIFASLTERQQSLLLFSLFFSWLLAFPFEGRVLYALTESLGINPHSMIFGSVLAHFIGLFAGGFVIRTMQVAKSFIIFSIIVSMFTTALFMLPPSGLWTPLLIGCSFLVGACIAAWGFFFQAFTPQNERIKTAADGMIYSNILMIIINMIAINLSPYSGLTMCLLVLFLALLTALKLPIEPNSPAASLNNPVTDITKPLVLLYVFVTIITFNSGLMYHVLVPAFEHLEWLTSWYWAIPYIIALYVMRNLPRSVNRTYILYVGIAMIGFSFLLFSVLDRSALSYLLINTLMLGACGIFDLFWWSILGEMMDFHPNPASIFGIGLSANVLGVLIGGMTGQLLDASNSHHSTLLALTIVCTVLIILPPLSKHLVTLLKTHTYLTVLNEMPEEQQHQKVNTLVDLAHLTQREREITALVVRGKTYKQISCELYVSENTIKTHIKNIYAKCNVQNRNQLIYLIMEQNHFPPK